MIVDLNNFLENDVHIWFVRLNQAGWNILQLRKILSEEELEQADAYRFKSHRGQYIIVRGFLRNVLANYAGIPPRRLNFQRKSYGKPYLFSHEELQFNLAHSDSTAILVVTKSIVVGADVERLRYDFEIDAIVENYFSEEEIESYRRVPYKWKKQAFFKIWTCKEAVVKAAGFGLYYPLNQFTVRLSQGAVTRLAGTKNLPYPVSEWRIRQINPVPGYIGAIAVQETKKKIRFEKFEYKVDRVE